MNTEIKEILKKNIGTPCYVYFYNSIDADYRSGVIKEVSDLTLTLFFKKENFKGEKSILFTHYIDIESIRSILFQEPNVYFDEGCVTDAETRQ